MSRRRSAALGGLDILINNAGMEEVKPSLEIDEALWDRILDTNLEGRLLLRPGRGGRDAALPERRRHHQPLLPRRHYRGIPTAVPYGSSKTGLLGMTRALAAEWAPMKIRVNACGAGLFPDRIDRGLLS